MAESPCVLQKIQPPSVGPAPLFIAVGGLVAKWAEISDQSSRSWPAGHNGLELKLCRSSSSGMVPVERNAG